MPPLVRDVAGGQRPDNRARAFAVSEATSCVDASLAASVRRTRRDASRARRRPTPLRAWWPSSGEARAPCRRCGALRVLRMHRLMSAHLISIPSAPWLLSRPGSVWVRASCGWLCCTALRCCATFRCVPQGPDASSPHVLAMCERRALVVPFLFRSLLGARRLGKRSTPRWPSTCGKRRPGRASSRCSATPSRGTTRPSTTTGAVWGAGQGWVHRHGVVGRRRRAPWHSARAGAVGWSKDRCPALGVW